MSGALASVAAVCADSDWNEVDPDGKASIEVKTIGGRSQQQGSEDLDPATDQQ